MPIWAWILIAVAVVALVVGAYAALTRRRTTQLQDRFGPEYDRTLERRGGRRDAEAELSTRVERREQLDIRPLSAESRERYLGAWRDVQAKFVDDPPGAVTDADGLVGSVMKERGYPLDDFEQRADDISVDHPQVVERYRSAHGIAQKNAQGQATTEDLRQAIQHYRALFDDLLEPAEDQPLQREDTEATDEAREERAARP
jgi:hypothetical protein